MRCATGEFVIEQMQKRPPGIQVDLRTYCEHALPAYFQWKDGRTEGGTHWKDVVLAKIHGSPRNRTRDKRLERERVIACEVFLTAPDTESRHKLWAEKTGHGKTAFHDRLKEAREVGLFDDIRRAAAGKVEKPE